VKTVLIPKENEKDLADIPDNVKGALEIVPVEHVSEVLTHALTKKIKPVKWTSTDKAELAGLIMGTSTAGLPEGGSAAH
jgi:ATP-dependent Lon protease